MALVRCPDCGRNISSEAPACPSCGRPMKSEEPRRIHAVVHGPLRALPHVRRSRKGFAREPSPGRTSEKA